jgi:hypothetical protein
VDPELPRKTFHKGVFELPYLQGNEYRSLLLQVLTPQTVLCLYYLRYTYCLLLTLLQFIPVLGTLGNILPAGEVADIQRLLWRILEVYDLCVDYGGHTPASIAALKIQVRRMMKQFHEVLGEFSACDCTNTKHHYNLHLTYPIYKWGSLRAVDTSFGEAKQRDVRTAFGKTSKRRAQLHTELAFGAARRRHIQRTGIRHGELLCCWTNPIDK